MIMWSSFVTGENVINDYNLFTPKTGPSPEPRSHRPRRAGQVLMPPPVLVPGASLMEKGDSGVLTFLLEGSVLLWVWSRCLAHLMLWYERRQASYPVDWFTPDVSTKNRMWPAAPQWLQPCIRSFTELNVNCTPWWKPWALLLEAGGDCLYSAAINPRKSRFGLLGGVMFGLFSNNNARSQLQCFLL